MIRCQVVCENDECEQFTEMDIAIKKRMDLSSAFYACLCAITSLHGREARVLELVSSLMVIMLSSGQLEFSEDRTALTFDFWR